MALTLRCRICELRDFFLLAFVCWHLNFLSIIRQESYFHCAIETELSCRKHHKKHKNCTFLMLQHDYPDLRFCCGFYWLFFSLLFQNEVLTLKLFFDKVTKLCQIFEMCHGTSLFTRTSCKWCPPYFLKNPACLSISKYYSMNCESVIFLSLLLSESYWNINWVPHTWHDSALALHSAAEVYSVGTRHLPPPSWQQHLEHRGLSETAALISSC